MQTGLPFRFSPQEIQILLLTMAEEVAANKSKN